MRLSRRPARGLPRALLLGLACALAAPAVAQPSAWVRLAGPHAAALRTAAVAEDGTLLAATSTDVYRYDGAQWAPVASAVNGSIHDIGPAPDGRVWAGTSGALRSDDGGQTWRWFSIRTAPHSGLSPSVLHVATGPDGTVYAGAFRTTNGGTTWLDMAVYAYGTAFVGTTAYAATLNGVHRSTTAGASWTPSGLPGVGVSHLAATGARLVAATEAGLYRSDDGTVWTPTAALGPVDGLAVAGDGAVWAAVPEGDAEGGLYRSADGATWPPTPTAFAGRPVQDVAAAGATLLALVEGNPYRSVDGGATWTELPDGLGFPYATAALLHDGLLAVAASGAGPFVSRDGSTTWTPWTDGLTPRLARQLLADPAAGLAFARTPTTAYRAALPVGTAPPGPWAPLPLPDGRAPEGLALDGAGTLLAITSTTGFEGAVYRSTDSGTTWTSAWEGSDTFRPLLAAGGGVAAVQAMGFFEPPRLFVSTDGGVTWTVRPHPLSGNPSASPSLFVDPAGRIYVADGNTLHRSADAGATWTVLGPAGSGGTVLTLEAAPGALCLSTGLGVWCSSDDGATFDAAGAGLSGSPVVALVHDGPQWAALTAEDGVFVSSATTATAPPPTHDGGALTVAPNPARDRAAVTLTLDRARAATVALYDALGRRVAVLHDGPLGAGAHTLALDTAALPPGVYVVHAETAAGTAARRVTVAR